MNISLRLKITFITIGLIIAIMLVFMVINNLGFSVEYEKILKLNAETAAKNLKMRLESILKLDIDINMLIGFERQCQDIVNNNENVSYAMVINTKGIILFHNNALIQNDTIKSADDIINNLKKPNTESYYRTIRDKELNKEFFLPVSDNNEIIAAIGVGFPVKIITSKINKVIFNSILISTLLTIIAVFILLFMLKFTLKPINEINNEISIIAKGEGDLTKKLDLKVKDEIGHLADNFNKFVFSLSKIISQIKETIVKTQSISTKLVEISENYYESLQSIHSNVTNVKSKSHNLDGEVLSLKEITNKVKVYIESINLVIIEQSSLINESSSAIEEMASSINNVANIIETKIGTVNDLYSLAVSGENTINETIDIIKKINEYTNTIMEMLKVINNIAAQTNLLAMNASIEAAHANEYGKGFSVVAQEIRNLATDTGNNAKNISKSMKEIIQYIRFSEESSEKSGAFFKNITNGIKAVNESMIEIKNAMTELNTGSKAIITSLSSLLTITSNINTSSHDIKNGMSLVTSSLDNVVLISNDTNTGMDEIMNKTSDIYQSIGIIKETGKQNYDNISEVEKLIEKFKV